MALVNAFGDLALDATLKDGTQKVQIVDAGGIVADVTAANALKVDGSAVTQPVSGPLTNTELRSTPVPVSGTVATGGLTDSQLRATPVPISGTVTATTGGLTDTQLRATPLPVSGTVTASGPITNAELRAAAVNTSTTDGSAAISISANAATSGSVTGLNGAGIAIIQLTGTFTATVQAQMTADGSTWLNVTGSNMIVSGATGAYMASGNLTAVGIYQVNIAGAVGVRVITTAYTSGTVTGIVRATPADGAVAIEGIPLVAQSGTWTVGVTGYPAAAASADGFANPTVTKVDTTGLAFNGATWDRLRAPSYTINSDTSSARTATGNGVAFVNYAGARNLTVWVSITAVSGTTPTIVFKLQWSPDNGTTWLDWDTTNLQSTTISTVSTYTLKVGSLVTTTANAAKQDYVPRQVRLQWTVTGTTPSFTFASWYTVAQ